MRAHVAPLSLFVFLVAGLGVSSGQSVVTLCDSDDQAGPGLNLTRALGIGPFGVPLTVPEQVRFQCGGPARIRITHLHEIFQNFDIDGGGLVTLDAGGTASMLRLRAGVTHLRLAGLTLRNSGGTTAPAGFIWSDPAAAAADGLPGVELVDCSVEDNAFGIEVIRGSVHALRTRFLSNSSYEVIAAAHVRIEDSEFSGNRSPIWSSGGDVTILRSTFTNNAASLLSACRSQMSDSRFLNNLDRVFLLAGCDVTIDRSVFDNNRSSDGGALYLVEDVRLTLNGTTFSNNVAAGQGGAIFVDRWLGSETQTIRIRRGVFQDNRASEGGAIHLGDPIVFSLSDATLDGVSMLFVGNTATGDGGAIAGAHVTAGIAGGVFVDNRAGGSGGALALYQRRLIEFARGPNPIFVKPSPDLDTTIANSLFGRNRATATGSAFVGSNATFVNSSVARNEGAAVAATAYGTARFQNTLFLANARGNCDSTVAGAKYVDRGHNLQFPGNACGASIAVADAALDDVFVPLPGSPAFARGETSVCLAPPINGRDVFGQRRPEGSACTIGAVEGDIEQALRRRKESGERGRVRDR